MDVVAAAQLACLLEATASKPGNVSPGRPFADLRYEDFLASAAAIGVPLAGAADRPLGATVRLAVEATLQWTRTNSNLGIVLLLAPLVRAALECVSAADGVEAIEAPDLRAALGRVLDETTVRDAADVYHAIRLASPGGLGQVEAQDVAGEPTLPLLDVMRLADARDGVAREYATIFAATFEHGAPALTRARQDGLSWNDAVVETYLTLLASRPDTHIIRRAGLALAADVTRRAALALEAGGVRTALGRRTIEDMDRAMRDPAHQASPGTTADLVAACVFVVLVGGGR
jgi:triphosphoribosyl-dephospho-CoA synthase